MTPTANVIVTPIEYQWFNGTIPSNLLLHVNGAPVAGVSTGDAAEYAIRHWIRNNCYITGSNVPAMDPHDEIRADRILPWWLSLRKENNRKGPQMACGTIANLYIGLCAAKGIFARKVICAPATGYSDVSAEFWSVTEKKWVHVIPYTCGQYASLTRKPLSYLEWSAMEREDGDRSRFSYASLGRPPGQTLPWPDGLAGYTDSAAVEAGNSMHVDGTGNNRTVQVWKGVMVKAELEPHFPGDLYPQPC